MNVKEWVQQVIKPAEIEKYLVNGKDFIDEKSIFGNLEKYRQPDKQQKQLILEVENPDYETREDKKVLMHRRIAFYQKNGMQLSGVTCNFYDNEYRIMYAGAHCEDTKVQEITMNTYLNFFGADVVRKRAVFHAL